MSWYLIIVVQAILYVVWVESARRRGRIRRGAVSSGTFFVEAPAIGVKFGDRGVPLPFHHVIFACVALVGGVFVAVSKPAQHAVERLAQHRNVYIRYS